MPARCGRWSSDCAPTIRTWRAGSFVDHPEDRAATSAATAGARATCSAAGIGRLRRDRAASARSRSGCRPTSNFNLVGASQVGKASLTGMRVLHRLAGRMPLWPFDPLPERGSVVVEIYTTIAAIAAGRTAGRSKMRTYRRAQRGARRDSAASRCAGAARSTITAPTRCSPPPGCARSRTGPNTGSPPAMTPEIARTEGWTFGAL